MFNLDNKYLKKVYLRMLDNTESATYQIVPFALLAFFTFPAFYFLNLNISGDAYENFLLRLLASFICFPLLFAHKWPAKIKLFLPIYWYFALFYTLPFFFTFQFLMNHASQFWVTNIMIMILFLLLMLDWISFSILLTLGVITAFICYYFSVEKMDLENLLYGELVSIVIFIFIGTFFSRSKSKLEAEKLEALKSFGATVAHELRTPLNAIHSGVEGIKAYLPGLIETYKVANNMKVAATHIRNDQLVSLEKSVSNVEAESNLANMTINMLLTNVRQAKLAASEITVFSAQDLVETALVRYPMQTEQRDLVHVNYQRDFMIQGDKELLIHILFNLLKNALYYVEAAQKGEISMWFDSDEKFNRIHFKDTGQGISPDDLPHIFERFYTRTYHGSGIGLAFCKTAMQLHKGSIICQSKLGEFAEFIISFPKMVQEKI